MHSENFNRRKIRLVSLLSFLFGFLDAFFIYVLSNYFSVISQSDNVGMFYLVAFFVVLVSLFFLQDLIRLIGRARVLYLFLGMSIAAAAVLATASSLLVSVAAALVLVVATNVTWVALDILLESFSQDKVSGTIRGLYLTIMNAGLLLAPFLSLKTLGVYGYEGIFVALVIGYTIIFMIALLGFRSDNRVFQEKLRLRFTIRKMFHEKNLLRIYHVSFAMEFFYAMMIIYTPLYLRSLDFSWNDIGIIFTIMLLPFVLFQYPLGVLADRYFGEREMLIGSIALTAGTTLTLPFLGAGSVFSWGLALFLTRVGVAGIEILRDSYFYKQIDGNDMDVIAFFRTARPAANIVGACLSVPLLFLFSLKSIFFLVSLMMLFSLVQAYWLEDTVASRASR